VSEPDRFRVPPRLGIAVLVFHVVLIVLHAWLLRRVPWGDEWMYWEASERVLAEGTSGLEPLWPPLYPWFLAAIRSLGGGRLAIEAGQTGLLLGTAWLVGDTCRRVGLAPKVGLAAAVLTATFPTLVGFAHFLWAETLHLFLMMALVWTLARARDNRRDALTIGALLGLAVQTKGLLLPFAPLLLAPLALRGSRTARAGRVGLAALALVITVLPTVIANQRTHGVATVAASGWFNAWVGLVEPARNDPADPVMAREIAAFREGGETFAERNAVVRRKVVGEVVERMGEGGILLQFGRQFVKQQRRLWRKSSFLTQQLRGGSVHSRGFGYRYGPRWIADRIRDLHTLLYAAVLAAACAGLAQVHWRTERWAWLPGLFLLGNVALFTLLHATTRYRVQMLPALFVFAAVSVFGDRPVPSRPRLALATVGAGTLLVLALWP
jgi:4-amino-4-deoxy-L-arabinose transferase-like glycosyltransferase